MILEKMRKRSSCRAFSNKSISDELLHEILETGLCSASGGNLQPYSIVLVKNSQSKAVLAGECGQAFISKAAVNLVFLLDWSKLKHFAESKGAPFVAEKAFNHNLIAFADVMCVAQTIETAANLSGLGCCFVANIQGKGAAVKQLLHLPEHCYPMLMLSMGYPAFDREAHASKLPYSAMIYEEIYTEDYEKTDAAFCDKYKGMTSSLPKKEPYRSQQLKNLQEALLTTYSQEEAQKILKKIDDSDLMNEMQRRFGLHYRAHEAQTISESLRKDMDLLGISL